MGYWSVAILFWQPSIDHIVNVQCKRCGLAKTRLRHPSLPFDSLPYPTHTIRKRVHTYAWSITWQPNEEVDHILRVWGSVSRALCVCGSPTSMLGLIKRTGYHINDLTTLGTLYCSLVWPKVEYASLVLNLYTKKNISRIESIQRGATTFILKVMKNIRLG